MKVLKWDTFKHEDWEIYLVVSEKGLCYAGIVKESFEEVESWVRKKVGNVTLVESKGGLDIYITGFAQYIRGNKKDFNIPLDLIGTDFQVAVWEALLRIPYGETVSYADIAKQIGRPKALRAVGTAVGNNPLIIVVPCHRVIRKDGGLGGFSAGVEVKRLLHKIEGIKIERK